MTTSSLHRKLSSRRTAARAAFLVAAVGAAALVPTACSSSNTSSAAGQPPLTVDSQPQSGQGIGGGSPGDQASGGAATPDACKLLAPADFTELFGQASKEPEAGLNVTGDDESFCDFEPATHELGKVVLLQVQIFNSPRYLPRKSYDNDITNDVKVDGASESFSVSRKDAPNTITVNAVVHGKRLVVSFNPGDKNAAARLDDTVKITNAFAAKL